MDSIKCIAKHYGLSHQSDIAIEEMSELIKELQKYKRGFDNLNQIHEEIADVEIMIRQLIYLFDCELEVELWKNKKIERTLDRMQK